MHQPGTLQDRDVLRRSRQRYADGLRQFAATARAGREVTLPRAARGIATRSDDHAHRVGAFRKMLLSTGVQCDGVNGLALAGSTPVNGAPLALAQPEPGLVEARPD